MKIRLVGVQLFHAGRTDGRQNLLFLTDFKGTWISTAFRKYSDIKLHENPSIGSRVVPCGTDGRQIVTQLTVAFRNFTSATKNKNLFPINLPNIYCKPSRRSAPIDAGVALRVEIMEQFWTTTNADYTVLCLLWGKLMFTGPKTNRFVCASLHKL